MCREIEREARAQRRRGRWWLALWVSLCAANVGFALVGGSEWATRLSATAAGFAAFHAFRTYRRQVRPLTRWLHRFGVDDEGDEDG